MDWKKTETIFIIAFLILDIFLLVLFIDSRMASSPTPLVSQTLEEKLKSENITYGKIPSEAEKGSYLSTEPVAFSQKDVSNLKGQKIALQNANQRIFSFLQKPVKIDPDKYGADLAPFLKSDVFKGDKYTYWSYDKDKMQMTFNPKNRFTACVV
ncbi:two-component system regulatory protein YycI [Listeria riparia]|uniref:two-component system regulatory protein YycI n=1 Tax=Listeria riparia TaxID=1494964 RepID=UPI0004B8D8AB|nr:two-component system regulatory protein YycI [Listeria riparia]